MTDKKYFVQTLLFCLIVTPLFLSLSLILAMFLASVGRIQYFAYIVPVLTLGLFWITFARKAYLPKKFWERFLPILISFCYFMIVWIILYGAFGYKFSDSRFQNILLLFTLPYFMVNLILSLDGSYYLFPFIQIAIFSAITVIMIFVPFTKEKKLPNLKGILIYILVAVMLISISLYQRYDSSTKVLYSSDKVERVKDEINIYEYTPFQKYNKLMIPEEKPQLEISQNYPKLDGATAAYPVYAALAQSIYMGLNEETVYDYVQCSKTDEAYERLINGEIDIFFGAQPSKYQKELAKSKGITLNLTPIGKEAFVFIVNRDNKVNSLTINQIQEIYQKKIANWKDVGGSSKNIMAFQRPQNSGSQTIMEAVVMEGLYLHTPITEESADFMGGLVNEVAEYRNYSSAIGYTFRYFVTDMFYNENVKLLAVNGVEPTVENIKNGSYPFTVDVYAVTANTENENVRKIIEWILSDEGQKFIEKCGYVGN